MKVTALIAQFPITLSVQKNLEIMDSILAQSTAGELVIFPEGSLSGYMKDPEFLKQIDQSKVKAGLNHLQVEAVRRKINIWAGACVYQDGKWFNAAYGFSPEGRTQVYYKINLANHERSLFTAGNHLPVFELISPIGKVMIGVQMCRELRFPEQWGWLARCGVQIFLHLNNAVGDDTFQSVWKSHLVSRAAETQRFVLSANNASTKQICPTIAVAPDGQVMGEIVSSETGCLHVELNLSEASHWYLDQCREDVVFISSNTKPLNRTRV